MAGKSALVRQLAVMIHDEASALSAPSGPPSAAISLVSWRRGGLGGLAPRTCRVTLSSDGSGTVPGPFLAVAYDAVEAAWYRVATLEGGADLSLTAAIGFAWHLSDLPSWADAIQLVAGGALTGGILVTSTATPIETDGDA
jgi:hypothetical protein